MSDIVSDLPGPVGASSGPTEGAVIASASNDAPASVVDTSAPASAPSIVGAPELKSPAVVAGAGEVVLAVEFPWGTTAFNPSIAGCPPVTKSGTAVPAEFADQVISIGATNGVTIVKR